MQKSAAAATGTWDFAIELDHASKFFTQRRRGEKRGRFGLGRMERHTVRALEDVSLRVRPGEFVAYAGPNGAGKSTTFKLLCGLLAPDAGQVRALGMDPMERRIPLMRRCGVLFGNRSELWWDHPVQASFDWKRVVWDIPQAAYEQTLGEMVELLDLGPFLGTFARELSLGQRMRADLALMLLHRPELVLLDEPTLGLDVLAKRQMISFLKRINREQGSTILVTSHDMDDLTEMAQRIIMIHQGHVAFDGTTPELRQVAGQRRTLVLTAPGGAPELPGLEYAGSEQDRHTYVYDAGRMSMEDLMRGLSHVAGLRDIETGEVPIEAVIAELYQGWQRG